jgi:hypothetical protein
MVVSLYRETASWIIFTIWKMTFLRLLFFCFIVVTLSCTTSDDYSLDSSIPRIQSPVEQIGYLRTKWKNGHHIETVLYDHKNRILEVFSFGRTSSKLLNQYNGNNLTKTIHYYHSDSAPSGFIQIDTLRREFDKNGRLMVDSRVSATVSRFGNPNLEGFHKRYLAYTTRGDTIVKKIESSYTTGPRDSSQVADISRWERDAKQQLRRYYRLYVFKGPHDPFADTIYHFSQRFAYDSGGRLNMAWFDSMYLGRFYTPAGPDTIWYRYNLQNRLVEERHRYTTDRRNKREIDTTFLSAFEKKSVAWYKKKFYSGDSVFANNNRIDLIRYHYERFDPAKHLPLTIPAAD